MKAILKGLSKTCKVNESLVLFNKWLLSKNKETSPFCKYYSFVQVQLSDCMPPSLDPDTQPNEQAVVQPLIMCVYFIITQKHLSGLHPVHLNRNFTLGENEYL